MHVAQIALRQLQAYTTAKGLFLPPGLKAQFHEMWHKLAGVIVKMEMAVGEKLNELRTEAWQKVDDEAAPLHAAIEAAIEARLHSHGKVKLDAGR